MLPLARQYASQRDQRPRSPANLRVARAKMKWTRLGVPCSRRSFLRISRSDSTCCSYSMYLQSHVQGFWDPRTSWVVLSTIYIHHES